MQRLKQNDSGAALPLEADEILSASTTQTLPSGGWCHVRMRLARDGQAERSVHHYEGADHSTFHHERVVVPAAVMAQLDAAVPAAAAERAPSPDDDEGDSQALYRTLVFRRGTEPLATLAVAYEDGKAVGPAAAFESAWRLFAGLFPRIGAGRPPFSDLTW
jgi:hypothetical protein